VTWLGLASHVGKFGKNLASGKCGGKKLASFGTVAIEQVHSVRMANN